MSATLNHLCVVKPILIVSPVICASRAANIVNQEDVEASHFAVIQFIVLKTLRWNEKPDKPSASLGGLGCLLAFLR